MTDNYDCGEVDCDNYKDGKCTYQGYCPNRPLQLVKSAEIVTVSAQDLDSYSPRFLRCRCGHCGSDVEAWDKYCHFCGYKLLILGGEK